LVDKSHRGDRFLSLWGVGSSETDADATLIDLKPQAALFVILGELAQLRVFFEIREKSFL